MIILTMIKNIGLQIKVALGLQLYREDASRLQQKRGT